MFSAAASVPTDNLYKFKAIAGLLTMAFGLTLLVWLSNEYENRTSRLATKVAVAEFEVDQFREDLEEISNRTSSDEEYEKHVDTEAIYQQHLELVRASSELKQELNSLSNGRYQRVRLILLLLSFLGLIQCGRGFHQWQKKVQNHLDFILENEAKSSSLELAKAQRELSGNGHK